MTNRGAAGTTEARTAGLVVLQLAGSFVLGLLTGVVGTTLQPSWSGPVPWGFAVAFALTAAVFLLCGWWTGSRGGTLAAVAGWLFVAVLASLPRPEGDLVLTAETADEVWRWGGLALAVLSLTVPYSLLPRAVVLSPRPAAGARPGPPPGSPAGRPPVWGPPPGHGDAQAP